MCWVYVFVLINPKFRHCFFFLHMLVALQRKEFSVTSQSLTYWMFNMVWLHFAHEGNYEKHYYIQQILVNPLYMILFKRCCYFCCFLFLWVCLVYCLCYRSETISCSVLQWFLVLNFTCRTITIRFCVVRFVWRMLLFQTRLFVSASTCVTIFCSVYPLLLVSPFSFS